MKFEIGLKKYGKIKPGQRWKKKDSGMVGTIMCRAGGDCWKLAYHNNSHTTKTRDIYRFYDKI